MTHRILDAKAMEARMRFAGHMQRYYPDSVVARMADELDAIRTALGGHPDSDLPSLAAAVRRQADVFDEQYGGHCVGCRDAGCPGFPWAEDRGRTK